MQRCTGLVFRSSFQVIQLWLDLEFCVQDLPAAMGELEPFTAVNLGPLLGSGGSGHVYRGTWNGATVAVKVSHDAYITPLQTHLA